MLIHKKKFHLINHNLIFHIWMLYFDFPSNDRIEVILELLIHKCILDWQLLFISPFPMIWMFKFTFSNFSYWITIWVEESKLSEAWKSGVDSDSVAPCQVRICVFSRATRWCVQINQSQFSQLPFVTIFVFIININPKTTSKIQIWIFNF